MTIDEYVKFRGYDGAGMDAFVSRPDGSGKHPAVIVIHEIWGLENQIRGVARRLASEGYAAIAPHLYSRQKEILTPENIEKAMGKIMSIPPEKRGNRDEMQAVIAGMEEGPGKVAEIIFAGRSSLEEEMIKDLIECRKFIESQDYVDDGKIGATGFCMGGGLTFQLATVSDIRASVVFYGSSPSPLESVKNITGKVMGLYAGEDSRINSGLPDLLAQFVENRKEFDMKIYEGAMHAFFNETRQSYNREAADDAWNRTLAFFGKHLR